jgi:hypothetical protein
MQSRKRTAQFLVCLGSLIMIAGCALHSTLGYRAIFGPLDQIAAAHELVHGLKSIWFIFAWHGVVIGILALIAAFVRTAPHRPILFLCGIVPLADSIVMYAFLGPFIGDEIVFASAVAFLAAAALFPASQN